MVMWHVDVVRYYTTPVCESMLLVLILILKVRYHRVSKAVKLHVRVHSLSCHAQHWFSYAFRLSPHSLFVVTSSARFVFGCICTALFYLNLSTALPLTLIRANFVHLIIIITLLSWAQPSDSLPLPLPCGCFP